MNPVIAYQISSIFDQKFVGNVPMDIVNFIIAGTKEK